jgi:hypothetical protein
MRYTGEAALAASVGEYKFSFIFIRFMRKLGGKREITN